MNIFKQIRYYFCESYRRKLLDQYLDKHRSLFSGVVLDIGGRGRGRFVKPKTQVQKWIFADINPAHYPDIVLDVAQMDSIEIESIDVICACELFEHVEKIEAGLDECTRVLKIGGRFIISVPFLYLVHSDPHDYQRWTETKWKQELSKRNFQIEVFSIMGRYFTVLADHLKLFIKAMPEPIRLILYLFLPLIDVLILLDRTPIVLSSPNLRNAHGGYFIIATKSAS